MRTCEHDDVEIYLVDSRSSFLNWASAFHLRVTLEALCCHRFLHHLDCSFVRTAHPTKSTVLDCLRLRYKGLLSKHDVACPIRDIDFCLCNWHIVNTKNSAYKTEESPASKDTGSFSVAFPLPNKLAFSVSRDTNLRTSPAPRSKGFNPKCLGFLLGTLDPKENLDFAADVPLLSCFRGDETERPGVGARPICIDIDKTARLAETTREGGGSYADSCGSLETTAMAETVSTDVTSKMTSASGTDAGCRFGTLTGSASVIGSPLTHSRFLPPQSSNSVQVPRPDSPISRSPDETLRERTQRELSPESPSQPRSSKSPSTCPVPAVPESVQRPQSSGRSTSGKKLISRTSSFKEEHKKGAAKGAAAAATSGDSRGFWAPLARLYNIVPPTFELFSTCKRTDLLIDQENEFVNSLPSTLPRSRRSLKGSGERDSGAEVNAAKGGQADSQVVVANASPQKGLQSQSQSSRSFPSSESSFDSYTEVRRERRLKDSTSHRSSRAKGTVISLSQRQQDSLPDKPPASVHDALRKQREKGQGGLGKQDQQHLAAAVNVAVPKLPLISPHRQERGGGSDRERDMTGRQTAAKRYTQMRSRSLVPCANATLTPTQEKGSLLNRGKADEKDDNEETLPAFIRSVGTIAGDLGRWINTTIINRETHNRAPRVHGAVSTAVPIAHPPVPRRLSHAAEFQRFTHVPFSQGTVKRDPRSSEQPLFQRRQQSMRGPSFDTRRKSTSSCRPQGPSAQRGPETTALLTNVLSLFPALTGLSGHAGPQTRSVKVRKFRKSIPRDPSFPDTGSRCWRFVAQSHVELTFHSIHNVNKVVCVVFEAKEKLRINFSGFNVNRVRIPCTHSCAEVTVQLIAEPLPADVSKMKELRRGSGFWGTTSDEEASDWDSSSRVSGSNCRTAANSAVPYVLKIPLAALKQGVPTVHQEHLLISPYGELYDVNAEMEPAEVFSLLRKESRSRIFQEPSVCATLTYYHQGIYEVDCVGDDGVHVFRLSDQERKRFKARHHAPEKRLVYVGLTTDKIDWPVAITLNKNDRELLKILGPRGIERLDHGFYRIRNDNVNLEVDTLMGVSEQRRAGAEPGPVFVRLHDSVQPLADFILGTNQHIQVRRSLASAVSMVPPGVVPDLASCQILPWEAIVDPVVRNRIGLHALAVTENLAACYIMYRMGRPLPPLQYQQYLEPPSCRFSATSPPVKVTFAFDEQMQNPKIVTLESGELPIYLKPVAARSQPNSMDPMRQLGSSGSVGQSDQTNGPGCTGSWERPGADVGKQAGEGPFSSAGASANAPALLSKASDDSFVTGQPGTDFLGPQGGRWGSAMTAKPVMPLPPHMAIWGAEVNPRYYQAQLNLSALSRVQQAPQIDSGQYNNGITPADRLRLANWVVEGQGGSTTSASAAAYRIPSLEANQMSTPMMDLAEQNFPYAAAAAAGTASGAVSVTALKHGDHTSSSYSTNAYTNDFQLPSGSALNFHQPFNHSGHYYRQTPMGWPVVAGRGSGTQMAEESSKTSVLLDPSGTTPLSDAALNQYYRGQHGVLMMPTVQMGDVDVAGCEAASAVNNSDETVGSKSSEGEQSEASESVEQHEEQLRSRRSENNGSTREVLRLKQPSACEGFQGGPHEEEKEEKENAPGGAIRARDHVASTMLLQEGAADDAEAREANEGSAPLLRKRYTPPCLKGRKSRSSPVGEKDSTGNSCIPKAASGKRRPSLTATGKSSSPSQMRPGEAGREPEKRFEQRRHARVHSRVKDAGTDASRRSVPSRSVELRVPNVRGFRKESGGSVRKTVFTPQSITSAAEVDV